MAAMNVSNAFLGAAPGVAAFNSLASLSGMSCRCRIGVRTTQTLINAKLVAASRLLDGDDMIATSRLLWSAGAA